MMHWQLIQQQQLATNSNDHLIHSVNLFGFYKCL